MLGRAAGRHHAMPDRRLSTARRILVAAAGATA
jgi:hypothetical protein